VPADRLKTLAERTRYAPEEVERRVFEGWERAGIFEGKPGADPSESYSIAIPPPNVTGALHMGHALNGSIQDVLIRVARMRGKHVRWIFGTDHAGIATQVKVEEQLLDEGITKEEIGREAFVGRVWEWRARYGSTIVEQYQRLGASADYAHERFTMDEDYARAVVEVFVRLFEKGLIYRDNYMVNWDPGTGSAISDLEVEQRSVEDTLYSIEYPLASGSGSVTVATVRPETMLADTAIAVNPADERYTRLIGERAILPLVGRPLPIIADDYVDPEFGTGALKITPGHDPNDFAIGRRHGLEEITVIGEDGRMNAAAGERFAGLAIDDARDAAVAALREEGRISASRPYPHDVPHSHPSGMRIEPLISLQWFCDMDALAGPAIDCVRDGRVRFRPEKPWAGVYLHWLENIRPWCVSRQLWWGHRLPVWYCDACGETFVARTGPERCGSCEGELRRDEDVLDTWFSSALWPFATLGWPEATPELGTFYPTDALSTARDIIFLWVARMVMMGIELTGQPPFADVPIHSVIQAPDGRRMSKSLGTGIDPLELIDRHGADALRFGLLAMSSSQDVRFNAEKVQQGQDLANKLWNVSRLILLNVDPAPAEPRPETVEDRWIVSRMERLTERTTAHVDEFEFARAALELYAVVWGEVCDWYLELVKPRLYDREVDRSALSSTLLWVLERMLVLLHPLMPFVTEEVWTHMPSRGIGGAPGLLAVHPWPSQSPGLRDERAEATVERAIAAVGALRRYRDEAGVPAGTRLRGRLEADGYEHTAAHIGRLARFDLEVGAHGTDGHEVAAVASLPVPGGSVHVLEAEGHDPAEAERRRAARLEALRVEVTRAEDKLSNEGFVSKAPEPVVRREREKLAGLLAELDGLADEPAARAGADPSAPGG
jgi:valyl-tRNA synthetase